jgi:hypothetical protein
VGKARTTFLRDLETVVLEEQQVERQRALRVAVLTALDLSQGQIVQRLEITHAELKRARALLTRSLQRAGRDAKITLPPG